MIYGAAHLDTRIVSSAGTYEDAMVFYGLGDGTKFRYEFGEYAGKFALLGCRIIPQDTEKTRKRYRYDGVVVTDEGVSIINDKARKLVELHDDARRRALDKADTEIEYLE